MSRRRTPRRGMAAAATPLWLCLWLWLSPVWADQSIAILGFELNDLTLLPQTPEELERTASIKPMLEEALRAEGGYAIVPIDERAANDANAGFGYLFDHPKVAARLGQQLGADWILVGRLHKPSFLFAYIMAHLVDTRDGTQAGNYIVEVKGPAQQVTKKGVERLAEKIDQTLGQ